METGLVTNTPQTTTSTSKAPSQELDKNAFLMLLVAQLKNQDPTSAQDPNQMVQQMTSYSQLEQLQNSNTLLQGIQLQNQGLFQAQAASLVGKQVRVTTPNFDLKGGNATVGVDLEAQAASVTIAIKDASGKLVAVLDQGAQSSGSHLFEWNGRDSQGNALPDGAYTVEVAAKDADGKAVTAKTSAYATVESVAFVNGAVLLMAGGRSFTLDNVNEIKA
jgi:flagellar basal-body rod modification protein FlgD